VVTPFRNRIKVNHETLLFLLYYWMQLSHLMFCRWI